MSVAIRKRGRGRGSDNDARQSPKKAGRVDERAAGIRAQLGHRPVVLVGLMGCGKSSIGRRLATALDLPFVDADEQIESAAQKTIEEIFRDHGEPYFRDGERKVIARLLGEGAHVLATGGGAFIDASTRALLLDGAVTIWLRAEFKVLMERVRRRDNRPLLKQGNPEETMRRLMAQRYPIYQEADLIVQSRDVGHEVIVDEIIQALADTLIAPASSPDGQGPGAAVGAIS